MSHRLTSLWSHHTIFWGGAALREISRDIISHKRLCSLRKPDTDISVRHRAHDHQQPEEPGQGLLMGGCLHLSLCGGPVAGWCFVHQYSTPTGPNARVWLHLVPSGRPAHWDTAHSPRRPLWHYRSDHKHDYPHNCGDNVLGLVRSSLPQSACDASVWHLWHGWSGSYRGRACVGC